jgi:hypothetical protein
MKILVIGDSIIDKYLWGKQNRTHPEDSSIPLLDITKIEYRLGGAANVAGNICALSRQRKRNRNIFFFNYVFVYGKNVEEIKYHNSTSIFSI